MICVQLQRANCSSFLRLDSPGRSGSTREFEEDVCLWSLLPGKYVCHQPISLKSQGSDFWKVGAPIEKKKGGLWLSHETLAQL